MRFRLSRAEVDDLGRNGRIDETVSFAPFGRNDFDYTLEKTSGTEFLATFADGCITVSVPATLVEHWVESEDVSIEGKQTLDDHAELKFLIEKDFVCLNAHNDEDQSDRYPHPKGDEAC